MTIVMKVNPDAFTYKAQDASRELGIAIQVIRDRGYGRDKTTYRIMIDGHYVSYCPMTARECWSALEAITMTYKAINERKVIAR